MLKKLAILLGLISFYMIGHSQVQISQPYKFLSWVSVRDSLRAGRGDFDLTFQFPVGCGAPSGTASLNGGDKKKPAFFYDSCAHNLYLYTPQDSSWSILGSGGGGGGVSSVAISSSDFSISGSPITSSGTITLNVLNNAITNAKLRQSAGLSIIGNGSSSTANVSDITAASDGQALRRNGTTLAFGSINLANSNAVTGILPVVNTDTNITSGLATRYALTNKSSITSLEGIIYNKSSWTSTSDFTQRGSFTATVSSNAIAFSGGGNDFARTLDLDTTIRERYVIHIEEKVGTVSSTSDGLGIGTRSVNTFTNYGISAILITNTTGNSGKILLYDVQANSVIATSTGTLLYSAGDTLVMDFERDRLDIKATAFNKTTGSAAISVSYTYSLTYGVSHVLPNTGTFSIFNVGGTNSMTALTITSKEAHNSALCMSGDSKFWYYAGTTSLGMMLDNVFRPTNIHGGPGDDLDMMLAAEDDIINQAPTNCAIACGSNDIGHGYTVSQTFTKYKQYVSRMTAAGINVFHLLPLYQPSIILELDSLADSIRAYYPAANIIDCRTPLRQCPTCYMSADNVHPNSDAQLVLYNTIINSGKLASYYKTPVAAASGSSLDLNGVLTNGNSSGLPAYFTGYDATQPKIKIGSLNIQPFAFNGIQLNDNGYYNGSNDIREATGYTSRLLFQNGHVFFETAGAASAGSTATYNLGLLEDPSGNVGIGGMNPASPLYSDGQLNITAATGKVQIPGYDGNDSKVAIGSLNISPHGFNNVTIADNAKYNGTASAWQRVGTGYASMLHLQNGYAYISTTGTSSAGSTITWNLPFLTDESGNVALGGMNISSPLYSDGSLYIPSATGKVHINNYDSVSTAPNMLTINPTTKALEVSAVPSGGNGIYTGSGSLSTNTTVSGASHSLALGASGDKLTTLTTNVSGAATYNSDSHTFNDGGGHSFGMNNAGWFSIAGSLNLKVERASDADFSMTTSGCVIILPAITAGRTLNLPATAREGMIYVVINTNSSGNTWSFGGGGSLVDQSGSAVTSFTNNTTYILMGDNTANKYRIIK